MIAAIVFDFDGVLADSEPLHLRVYQDLLAPSGVTLTKDDYCARYLGMDDEGAFKQMAEDYALMLGDEEIELLMREKASRFEALVSGRNVLYPSAAPAIARLGAVWPIGIASGAMRRDIELIIRGARLENAFRFIVAAEDTDRTKPAPDPYLLAAKRHGVAPASCVAIEDSRWGLESARTAGMHTIAVATTYPRAELLPHADLVIDSLDDATEALLRAL